jgi:hypothetical protein
MQSCYQIVYQNIKKYKSRNKLFLNSSQLRELECRPTSILHSKYKCQFHQHLMSSLLVRKLYTHLFVLEVWLCRKKIVSKAVLKMLVKLSTDLPSTSGRSGEEKRGRIEEWKEKFFR